MKAWEKLTCCCRLPAAFAAGTLSFFALSLAWGAGSGGQPAAKSGAWNQSKEAARPSGRLSHEGSGAPCRPSFESLRGFVSIPGSNASFSKPAAAAGFSAPAHREQTPSVYSIVSGDFGSSLNSYSPLFSYKGDGFYALNKIHYERLFMILESVFAHHKKGVIVTSSLAEARSLRAALLKFLPDLEESIKLGVFHRMLPQLERKKIQEEAMREEGYYIISVQALPDSINIPPLGVYIDLNINKTAQSRLAAAAERPLVFSRDPAPDILVLDSRARVAAFGSRPVKRFLEKIKMGKRQRSPVRTKETKMSLKEAMAIVRPFKFSSLKDFYRWARSEEAPEKFPKDPYQYYRHRGLWPGWAVFLGQRR